MAEHSRHDLALSGMSTGRVCEIVRRLSAALFGLILAFLSSVVHTTHTCQECSVASVYVGAEPEETLFQLSALQASPPSPCLACLFTHAMRSTLAAVLGAILFWMAIHEWLAPPAGFSSPSKCFASGFRIRAPPSHPSALMR
jgi:hypothetical protein